MKKTTRRLMSILLALALVCSMVPAGLAAWGYDTIAVNQQSTISAGFASSMNFGGTLDLELKSISWASDSSAIDVSPVSYYGSIPHQAVITGKRISNEPVYITATATYGVPYFSGISDYYENYVQTDVNTFVYYVSGYSSSTGVGGSNTGYLANLSQGTMTLEAGGAGKYLYIEPAYAGYTLENVEWAVSGSPYIGVTTYGDSTSVVVNADKNAIGQYASATIIVTADVYNGYRYVDSVTLGCSVTTGSSTSTGTGSSNLYLSSDSMQLAVGQGSVLNALSYSNSVLPNLSSVYWYSTNPSVASVYNYYGSSVSGYTYGESVQVYGQSVGQATICAELRLSTGHTLYASCEVVVGGGVGSSIDVMYSTTTGKSLTLDEDDFEDFWQNSTYSRGELQYVVFGGSSGTVGKLVYNRKVGSSYQSSVAIGSASFYADPAIGQYGIDDITFTPNKVGSKYNAGTLTVPFTAYGTTAANSSAVTSASGVLHIVVTNGAVQAISCTPSGSSATLDPSDFIAVYKQAMGTTAANPTVFIQFLDVPNFGELHFNYGGSIYSTSTALTNANISTMRFTSRSTGAYCIEDVTYIPSPTSTMGEIIRYAAYSSAAGGTLLYIGEIHFAPGETPTVKYVTTVGKAVDMDLNDFRSASAEFGGYVTITSPDSGALYRDYANGKGTAVSGGSTFALNTTGSSVAPSINDLTFVPSATGIVEMPFISSNILGGQVNGLIKVYVGKSFADVPDTHWAEEYITQLTAEGIVNGKTATTFAPGDNLKYGEALKLVMEAAGYSAQTKTGSHWASGYLTRAFRDGLVSSSSIDLESQIDRTTVATLAAKALNLGTATSVKTGLIAPTDTTNGYVLSLYNAGILNGQMVGGKNYFYGSNTITRAEISKIICLVSDYYNANK